MTATFEALRTRPGNGRAGRRQHRTRSGGEGLTLERKLMSVWEGLLTTGAAECPVCGGALSRAGSEAGCAGCGATIT